MMPQQRALPPLPVVFLLVIGAVLIGFIASYVAVPDVSVGTGGSTTQIGVVTADVPLVDAPPGGTPGAESTDTSGTPAATPADRAILAPGTLITVVSMETAPDGTTWYKTDSGGYVDARRVRVYTTESDALNAALAIKLKRAQGTPDAAGTASALGTPALTPAASAAASAIVTGTATIRGSPALAPAATPLVSPLPTRLGTAAALSLQGTTISPTASATRPADALGAARDLLAANPDVGFLATSIQKNGVKVSFAALPAGVTGEYDAAPNQITISDKYRDADPHLVAAILAHEATHADDSANSRISTARPDWDAEERAFRNAALLWRGFYGPRGEPDPGSDVERDLNNGVAVLDDPAAFTRWVHTHDETAVQGQ